MTTAREFGCFFPEFSAPSWGPWNAIEERSMGIEPSDIDFVRRVTGRSILPPGTGHRVLGGQGSWRVVAPGLPARRAAYVATRREYSTRTRRVHLCRRLRTASWSRGNVDHVPLHHRPAAQRAGVGRAHRLLRRAIPLNSARESSSKSITASGAAPRGRAYVCVIVEEARFPPNHLRCRPDVGALESGPSGSCACARVRCSLSSVPRMRNAANCIEPGVMPSAANDDHRSARHRGGYAYAEPDVQPSRNRVGRSGTIRRPPGPNTVVTA